MKAYKQKEKNEKLRAVVKDFEKQWNTNKVDRSMRYYSAVEFTSTIATRYQIPCAMAEKVTWLVRGDAQRDKDALELFGFNKHTA